MPPRHSSPRFTRSLPRSRPPDSSVSIERTWLAERIRCAYVCARARACSIMRSRDRGRRLEECWSKRIINAILGRDKALIRRGRGSLMEFHEPLDRNSFPRDFPFPGFCSAFANRCLRIRIISFFFFSLHILIITRNKWIKTNAFERERDSLNDYVNK